MTEVVKSYFSNTNVLIASYTVDQSFFHKRIVPISDPNISENFVIYLNDVSLYADTCI